MDPAQPWTIVEELLAQIVEEVGVLAAERRREKPRQIPRPTDPDEAPPVSAMHGGLLAAAMKKQGVVVA